MSKSVLLKVDGEVTRPLELTFEDLCQIDGKYQLADVSRFDPKRDGDAVKLSGLLDLAGCRASAKYLGLHSASDNFHASIPLDPVRDRAFFIYRIDGKQLPDKRGGPIRFYIPDFAACHTEEIDECANVKFVDHVELTSDKGFDNRPEDDEEHEALHRGGSDQ